MARYVEERISDEGRESQGERRARESVELLQELRIMIPGVQILFALLLVVPFSARFDEVTLTQRYVFFGTVAVTAAATAFLMAPSAHHRVLWRRNLREERLRSANRLTLVGLGCLLLPMAGTVFLVSAGVFGSSVAAVACSAMTLFFVCLWFVHPLVRASGDD